jgi:hypothetical protein
VGRAGPSGGQGGEVSGLRRPESGSVVTVSALSYYCTMKVHMESVSHQVVANGQNVNKGSEHTEPVEVNG